MISGVLFSIVAYLIGIQLCRNDIKPFSGKYNYVPGRMQYLSLFVWVLSFAIIYVDIVLWSSAFKIIIYTVVFFFVYALLEWILARLNIQNTILVWFIRLITIAFFSIFFYPAPLTSALLAGVFYRNSPLGVVMPKGINLRNLFAPRAQKLDVQALINKVVAEGGGVVKLPAGKYIVDGIIQINNSNITLEGETDEQGNLLTELICSHPTVNGEKNPWISPFFITTGENIQPSNIFWGLDFRNKKAVKMESSSLSDPGSDGTILSPDFATKITAFALKGDTIIKVEDSSKVGKYIMLGLYNTTDDGNLIHDILGVKAFKEEWAVANRAGEEGAPSYQWLAEVKNIIDKNTIELATPLLRDIDMVYTPEIFNAEMLENIHIKNLKLSTRWNGLFHHHGLPLYYSVRQAQEMDYGWNGINLKRVVHGSVTNVVLENFTNPLYVMDARENICEKIIIKGYDGHQGLKVYCHACNNTFRDIVFYAHFADMMGGEGNAYDNVFENISYKNPHFNPVDYDFHGFAEGPFSPPADNTFKNVSGFRYIKGAGPVTHLPSMAQNNVWVSCPSEGGSSDKLQFIHLTYRKKTGLLKIITAVGFTIVMAMKQKCHSISFLQNIYKEKLESIEQRGINIEDHYKLFSGNYIM